MNPTEYTYLLNNPNIVSEKQIDSLEKVLEKFPYFQSAHALRLKGLYNHDSYKYNLALKQTASHTTDRSVLFDFISSDEFTIIQKDNYEKKLAELHNIEVIDSTIFEKEEVNEVEFVDEIEENKVPLETIDSVIPEHEEKPLLSFDFQKDETGLPIINDVEDEVLEKPISDDSLDVVLINPSLISEDILELKGEIFETNNLEPFVEKTSEEINVQETLEIEEKLAIGKPIEFAHNEKHSFQEWLQLTSFKPIDREEKEIESETTLEKVPFETKILEEISEKQKKIDLIDKFIQANPKITPARELSDMSIKPIEVKDSTELMTETLAKVFLEQKKYQKAIQAYEILILKNPEKSYFFADRIKDIKILQQNNQ